VLDYVNSFYTKQPTTPPPDFERLIRQQLWFITQFKSPEPQDYRNISQLLEYYASKITKHYLHPETNGNRGFTLVGITNENSFIIRELGIFFCELRYLNHYTIANDD